MQNYFNYFTEIEEHFQRRRGSLLLLSTLDWALIETWKDAGVPLAAVLQGIDTTFEKYERRKHKTRRINGLAYCAQEVLAAVEDMKEAATGAQKAEPTSEQMGLGAERVADFLLHCARDLDRAELPLQGRYAAQETAERLRVLAEELRAGAVRLEDLERNLTVLEEKLHAALLHAVSEEHLLALRTEADRAIAPYRSKMPGAQIEQLQRQYMHKRLLEQHKLPRLSLFYM